MGERGGWRDTGPACHCHQQALLKSLGPGSARGCSDLKRGSREVAGRRGLPWGCEGSLEKAGSGRGWAGQAGAPAQCEVPRSGVLPRMMGGREPGRGAPAGLPTEARRPRHHPPCVPTSCRIRGPAAPSLPSILHGLTQTGKPTLGPCWDGVVGLQKEFLLTDPCMDT